MEKNISFNNKQISYQAEGEGKVLVFIHGFLENRSIWDDYSKILSTHFQIISIDMPGFGKSACVAEIHTMEMMADIIKNVLDKEQVKKCVFVGHSMGGYIGASFAERYPEYLTGLVFFHSHAASDSDEVKVNRNRTIELVKQDALKFIISFIPQLFADENQLQYQQKIEQLQKQASHLSAQSVIAALAGMRDRKDQCPLLETLTIPILFVVGKKDSRIPMDKIIPQIQLPQQAEVLILDGVGHMGFVEAEELILQVLKSFVFRCYQKK